MASVPSSPTPGRRDLVVLPARRLLAIDAGSRAVKLLQAEEMFGRFRVLRHELVELQGDSPAAEEEALNRARAMILEFGDHPIALALPHYRALSQVIDLPGTAPGEVRTAIEEEVHKLSGLGESQIVHDYSPLATFGRNANPFWVTLCQAVEVQRFIERCGVGQLDLCEVTTSANALAAAFQAAEVGRGPAVLLDLGGAGTTLVIILEGQPVYAATFALGGGALLANTPVSGGVPEAGLQRWLLELQRVLGEWLRDHPSLELAAGDLDYYLAGGLAEAPGLEEALSRLSGLRFHPWPRTDEWPDVSPGPFAVAYGSALHALGRAPHPASLLPDEVRVYWNRHHSTQVLHSILFFLLVVLVLALGFGTWQKVGLLLDKRRMLDQAAIALERARNTETLMQRQVTDYLSVKPVLARQLQTTRMLQTLALLQQARSNQSFWYVLVADRATYDTASPPPSTNPPPATVTNTPPPVSTGPETAAMIAELSIPEQGEARRRILSQVVTQLRASPIFRNVDSLPDDRHRPLADPAVLPPDSHATLLLEFAPDPFEGLETIAEKRTAPAQPAPDNRPVNVRTPVPSGEHRTNGTVRRSG